MKRSQNLVRNVINRVPLAVLLGAMLYSVGVASVRGAAFGVESSKAPATVEDASGSHQQPLRHSYNEAVGEAKIHDSLHGITATVDTQGLRIETRDGLAWRMRLRRYGYAGSFQEVRPAAPRVREAAIELVHDANLTEWYLDTPRGLEQGFTLTRPPVSQHQADADRALEIVFTVGGSLVAQKNSEGLILTDSRGHPRVRYGELRAYDAGGRVLPAHMVLADAQLRLAVDVRGATFPVTIDPLFSAEDVLRASDAQAEDEFGSAVAVEGDLAVVGAPSAAPAGAAYVFSRDPLTQVWSEQAKLVPAGVSTADEFGSSVAVQGNSILVGAPSTSPGGAVYLFTRDVTTGAWTQRQILTASDAGAGDGFGRSVAVQGNTTIIGAPSVDEVGAADAGAAYVFTRDSATGQWIERTPRLTASDAGAGDEFAGSVVLDGNTLLIGAPGADLTDAALGLLSDAGAAYLFTRDSATGAWTERQILTASDVGAGDEFGRSVMVEGNTALVGAPGVDLDDATLGVLGEAGASYAFTRDPTTGVWTERQILTASDAGAGDRFGRSVVVEGNTALVGAPGVDLDDVTLGVLGDAGATFVYTRDSTTGNWNEQEILTDSAPEANAQFGLALALDAATALAGAPFDDVTGAVDVGAAIVFRLDEETAVIQLDAQRITAADARNLDRFASAVGVSADLLVAGAPDADVTGVIAVGTDAGAGYVFARDPSSGSLDEVKLIAGDPETGARFGFAVAADGDTVVVGAPQDDLNTPIAVNQAGAAYVFSRDPGLGNAWTQTAKLTALLPAEGDRLGSAVVVEGDTLMLGAPGLNLIDPALGEINDAGAVFVFERDPATGLWTQQARLTASDAAASTTPKFGTAVALAGDVALVGAPDAELLDPTLGVLNNAGVAYVFVRDPQTGLWSEVAKLTAEDAVLSNALNFGSAVALSGASAVVGAPGAELEDPTLGVLTNAGAAYVFARDPDTGQWTQQAKLTAADAVFSNTPALGESVTFGGDIVVAGAPGTELADETIGVLTNAGAAYLFSRELITDSWLERSKLVADVPQSFARFGRSAALGGSALVIGAPETNLTVEAPDTDPVAVLDSAGAAFAFEAVVSEPPSAPDVGNGRGSGGSCFIATAAFGSYLHPHVRQLRQFRDRHLLTNAPGRALIRLYYWLSPPIAQWIREHELARVGARWMLTPLVYTVRYPQWSATTLFVVIGLVVGFVGWRRMTVARESVN